MRFEVSAEERAHLHGPVGLALGAKSPAEIVQVKNGVAGSCLSALP